MDHSRVNSYWFAPLFLAVSIMLFWRPGQFFFNNDDWAAILAMAQNPFWKYLTMPDAEMWMPFSRLVYYGLIKAAGENYGAMLLITCFLTGANAFLFFLFLRRHIRSGFALVLGLFYAGAAVNSATAQMAYYINAILCLGFVLLALLLTDSYGRSSSYMKALGIGFCALLSIISWNYSLLAILTLPPYVLLVGQGTKRQFWIVTLIIVSILLLFTLGYLNFAGFRAAGSHNPNILSQFPVGTYLFHWFLGAFISPACYVFWGDPLPLPQASVLGIVVLSLILMTIMVWGEPGEKRLGMWALILNGSPFLLVALARRHFPYFQALSHRYGVFTLIGVLILLGIAATILIRRMPPPIWAKYFLIAGILGAMVYGQLRPYPGVRKIYLDWGDRGKACYQSLVDEVHHNTISPAEASQPFCPGVPPPITKGQALDIYRFLTGVSKR